MSITQTVSVSHREDAGTAIQSSVTLSDTQSAKLDLVANAGSYADAPFALTPAKVSLLFILSSADVTLQSGGTDEVQTLTPGGSPGTGDTFYLGFNGQNTGTFPFTASAAALQAALAGLSTIGPGNVEVTGPDGGPWTVKFVAGKGRQNLPQITAVVATTTGAGLGVSTTSDGAAPTESLSPKAGIPILWVSGCGMSFPFASTVSQLRAVNAGGQQATVKVRALYHA